MAQLPPPQLDHFADLLVDLGPPMELGEAMSGRRRIIPIIGGTVTGERINGTICNLGADWQTVFSDGTAQLDTRYGLKTDDGALIEIINFGYRHGPADVLERVAKGEDVDPALYYMRTHAKLETGDPRYAFVNNMLFVGSGAREASRVRISLFVLK